MVRLKDIAERAGVSVMTVSKALRAEPDVSPTTRARIKALAQEMGYVPDSTAQGLRSRTSRLLGVVISSITNPLFTRVVRAIEEQAYQAGYDVIIAHTFNDTAREHTCIRRLLSRRVDGLFISPVYRMETEAHIYQELLTRGTPTVLLGHPAAFCSAFPGVSSDDLLAGYHITKHLLGLGHKRIAFLAGRLVAPWAQERLEGYRRAMEIADSPNVGICLCVGCWLEGGEGMGKDILETIRYFGERKKIFKVHFRNVDQPLPHFVETFLDHGYFDMYKVMRALRQVDFDGVMIPDHIPMMGDDRRVGTAFTIGYMKALVERANAEARDAVK